VRFVLICSETPALRLTRFFRHAEARCYHSRHAGAPVVSATTYSLYYSSSFLNGPLYGALFLFPEPYYAFFAGGASNVVSSSTILDLPDELLERLLQSICFEDLRTVSLVSKRFLDASNSVRKSLTFDKWAGKEALLRLTERFSTATALRFGGRLGNSGLVEVEAILGRMNVLKSLDLSRLSKEIASLPALNSILRHTKSLTDLRVRIERQMEFERILHSVAESCPLLEILVIRDQPGVRKESYKPNWGSINAAYIELVQSVLDCAV
jgi:hypothetical protein